MISVLMPAPLPPLIQDALDARFQVHRLYAAPDRDAMLRHIGADVRAVATGVPILTQDVSAPLTGALMSALPALEIVANLGVGYDNIDAAWAGANGVIVTNTPDVLTEETADTAFGLLLNAVRQFARAERWLRKGQWLEGQFEPTASLRERTMGILGLGRIGKAIARRAEAFGVKVLYHNRKPDPSVGYHYCSSLLEMARLCDILMIAAPGGPQTHNIVNREVIDALGSDGILVNIARGSLVDESALIDALREKRILTAALDVYAHEPRVPLELIAMDHVVLLPHVGSASHHARDAMSQLVIDNLFAWADGNDVLTPVAETPWRRSPPRNVSSRGL
ncbi:MAG: 2-hydroxyacid dehydrogenase [Beijerinckiaceae bacterium]|nr:2-hydroxyacid dehydrogenase [Beijerinckiaceae bacterium]